MVFFAVNFKHLLNMITIATENRQTDRHVAGLPSLEVEVSAVIGI